ncbi:MAG: hypothetical protein ACREBR_03050 [bacterium]
MVDSIRSARVLFDFASSAFALLSSGVGFFKPCRTEAIFYHPQ